MCTQTPQVRERGEKEDSTPQFVDEEAPAVEPITRDRRVCLTLIGVSAILVVLSVVVFAIQSKAIVDWLDDSSSDNEDPVTVLLWFLAGIGVWLVMFLPYSLWLVPCVYFLRAWPGIFLVVLNVLSGQTLMFLIGKWLQQNTRVGERMTAVAPQKTKEILAVRQIFRTQGYKLCFLAMFAPLPTPLLVGVVGLLTEAELLSFTASASCANLLLFTPPVILGLVAGNLSDAFSDGDWITASVIICGMGLFVFMLWYASRLAKAELQKIADSELNENDSRL